MTALRDDRHNSTQSRRAAWTTPQDFTMPHAAASFLSPVLRSAAAWALGAAIALTSLPMPASPALAAPLAASPSISLPAPFAVADDEQPCTRSDQPPLPAPGSSGATGFWSRYREPLPP